VRANFRSSVEAGYIEITQTDTMVHKSVATPVNGLREYLEVKRKRVPGKVLFEADRLESNSSRAMIQL
jgi:hypothetical protein